MTIFGDLLRRWTAVYNSVGTLVTERRVLAAGPGVEFEDGTTTSGEAATIVRLADALVLTAQESAPPAPTGYNGQLYADVHGYPRWVIQVAGVINESRILLALQGSATYAAASVAGNTVVTTTVSVPNSVRSRGVVVVTADACPVGLSLQGYVSVEGTVTVIISNFTSGTVTIPGGVLTMRVAILGYTT